MRFFVLRKNSVARDICNDNVLTNARLDVIMNATEEVYHMDTQLNVATAPKDSTFQVRINSEIKKQVEEIYAKAGMTLTDAFNIFIQQSLNVEGLPFLVTTNSKEALREQSLTMRMLELKREELQAETEYGMEM